MGLKIVAPSGGSIELVPAATASAYTVTLPAATTTLMGTDSAQTLTSKTLSGATWTAGAGSVLTHGTLVATTSGTSIDFTGIPSWVKGITVVLNQVSTNGTSPMMLQLGTASSFEATGYITSVGIIENNGTTQVTLPYTTGVGLTVVNIAASTYSGNTTLTLQDSSTNFWSNLGTVYTSQTTATLHIGGGGKSLASTLTRIRLTTVGGTNTFDAGSVNIFYE